MLKRKEKKAWKGKFCAHNFSMGKIFQFHYCNPTIFCVYLFSRFCIRGHFRGLLKSFKIVFVIFGALVHKSVSHGESS